MRAIRVAVAILVVSALAACGSDPDPTMPTVVGKHLDVARSDISRAGINDQVEVVGGGTFGILDESNWTVCDQVPAAGQPVSESPRVTVARSCGNASASPNSKPSVTPGTAASASASASPAPTASKTPSASASPVGPTTMTVKNNADLAALLKLKEPCSSTVAPFAAKYSGQTVEFDGNIAYVQLHGKYTTRWDFLIGAGDYDPDSARGPNFKIENAGRADMHVPDEVEGLSIGDNVHLIAVLGEYKPNSCLFFIEPVATTVR